MNDGPTLTKILEDLEQAEDIVNPHVGWTTVYGEERCDHCGISREIYEDDPELYDVCDPDPGDRVLRAPSAGEGYMAAWRQHQELHR